MSSLALLSNRAVLEVSGPDARSFLQGLVTNDIGQGEPGDAVYAGLLTPQGKLLFEFFLFVDTPGRILVDVFRPRADEVIKRLTLYRLRARVSIQSLDLAVAAAWPQLPDALPETIVYRDPRLSELGFRLIGHAPELRSFANVPETGYDAHRLALGIADSGDLPPDQVFPLDAGFEELNGVSFHKGCYVGQEVTARMKHRATSRRRILIAEGGQELPPVGTPVMAGSREVGSLFAAQGALGLALVRLDRLGDAEAANTQISAGGIPLSLKKPSWLRV